MIDIIKKIKQKYCSHNFVSYWGNILYSIPINELKVYGCGKCGKEIIK